MPVNSPLFSIDVFNHYNTHVPTGIPITPMPTTESAEGTSITPMISNSLESPITPMIPISSEKTEAPSIQPGQTIKRILATYDETSATTIKRIKPTTAATSIIPPWRQKPPATPLRRTTTPAVMTPVQPAFPPPNYLLQKRATSFLDTTSFLDATSFSTSSNKNAEE